MGFMESNRALAAVGLVVVLILAIILGTLFYLNKTFHSSSNPVSRVVVASTVPTLPETNATAAPTLSPAGGNPSGASGATKIYSGTGFRVEYPSSWGILTCSNSSNFELDPISSADQLSHPCNYAVKPVTILVHQTMLSCPGNSETIGSMSVTKGVTAFGSGIQYRWCTQTTPQLDITERVSGSLSSTATSNDYSYQVEQILSTLSIGGGS